MNKVYIGHTSYNVDEKVCKYFAKIRSSHAKLKIQLKNAIEALSIARRFVYSSEHDIGFDHKTVTIEEALSMIDKVINQVSIDE